MPHKTEDYFSSEQWIQLIEILVPFFINLLWAIVSFVIFLFVRKPLVDALESILNRIRHGNAFTTPIFGMSDFIQPQTESEKQQKSKEEFVEGVEVGPPAEAEVANNLSPRANSVQLFRSQYLHAEDQAMGLLEKRFGKPIFREIKVDGKFLADGVFHDRNRLHIIEVKLVKNNVHPTTVDRFLQSVRTLPTEALAETIVHLIIIHTEDVKNQERFVNRIRNDNRDLSLEIEFHKYSELD